MRHHANFRGDGQNVAEIRRFVIFSNMAVVCHLGFVVCIFGPPTTSICCYAKFCWNQWNSLDNMHDFKFCPLDLKMPIHAPKLAFWGL